MTTSNLTVTITNANANRRLHSSRLAAVTVDRRIPAAEATEAANRLACAAIGVGERARISRPAEPTDDDVVVLAFIQQQGGTGGGTPLALENHCGGALNDLTELLRAAKAPDEADRLTEGELATGAVAIVTWNGRGKPPAVLETETLLAGRRSRLLLAASLLVQEAARLDREHAAANPV